MLSNSYCEIHYKMLPAIRAIALSRTTKTMRTAVEKTDAVVQARGRIQFPDGQGLLGKLIGLNAWCKVTVSRLCCVSKAAAWQRAEGGRWQRHCALTLRLRRPTYTGLAWERAEGGRWRRHCAATP